MRKIINPCKCLVHTRNGKEVLRNAFVKIEYKDGKLSLSGVVAPLPSGNCLGSAGQCDEEIKKGQPTDEWTREMLDKLCDIWDKWHLNNMRPYCQHMKELNWHKEAQEKIKIETWTLKDECSKYRDAAENRALECLREGKRFYPTKDEVAYSNLEYSKKIYNDEDISYCGKSYKSAYELKEKNCLGQSMTEYKTRGWIRYEEHPLGFIGRPCPICGYTYGSSWLKEEVPEDVIECLESLPETKITPAWV